MFWVTAELKYAMKWSNWYFKITNKNINHLLKFIANKNL